MSMKILQTLNSSGYLGLIVGVSWAIPDYPRPSRLISGHTGQSLAISDPMGLISLSLAISYYLWISLAITIRYPVSYTRMQIDAEEGKLLLFVSFP